MKQAKAAADKAAQHDEPATDEGQAIAKKAFDLMAKAVKSGMDAETILVRAKQGGRPVNETLLEAAGEQFNAVKHMREKFEGLLEGAGFGSILASRSLGP